MCQQFWEEKIMPFLIISTLYLFLKSMELYNDFIGARNIP
jgi:hypothetical protein